MLVAKAVLEKKPLSWIKHLLDLKGDPNSRYQTHQNPLNTTDLTESALHYASWCRDGDKGDSAEVASLLLERKANIHALANPFGTPLHFATHHYFGQNKIIQVLLKHGANPWISYHGRRCSKVQDQVVLSGDCSICLEPQRKETTCALLPCLHLFHNKCIET